MWIQNFVDYLRYEKNYSQRTIEAYRADLEAFRQFFKVLDNQLTWDTLDKDVVRQWVVSLMDKGNAPSSVSRRLSSVKSFYKFLLQRSYVDKDPSYTVAAPKKAKPLPTFLRESEMDLLLDKLEYPDGYKGKRDHLILLMFYTTGIRVSELVGLNVEDVDFSLGQLKVLGKWNKHRVVPFGEELAQALQHYMLVRNENFPVCTGSEQPLFLDERHNARVKVSKVQAIVKKYLSMVTTQKKKSPHVLRHTFATSMLNHHADLQSVKELLGHKRLTTTEVYTHTTFEELKEMYNLAHPRAK